jgi:para-nitrobenzyl esterase
VWIYGGKFLWGAGSDPNFDGTWLASQGIVCITFNYRLGILGWLAHPELSEESGHKASGNYGLLDQIACLEWIQRNITAFGGDPGRVTISGQSAGSACVGYHVYGPLSKGLFHGAIFQSGGRYPRDPLISCLAPSYRSKEQAESEGEMIFKEKGATSVQEMRDMSLEDLLVGNHRDDNTMWGPPPFYRACLDGWAFPRTYEESLLTGQVNDVPLMNGQNKDESGNYTHPEFNEDDLKEVAAIKYGDFADRWMSLYGNEHTTLLKWNTATCDHSRVGPHMHHELWSKHAKSPIYIYHFVHAPPYRKVNPTDYEVPKSKGYTYFKGSRTGAYHAAEIPYTFHSLAVDPVFRPIDYAVADKVGGYWANFIKTGDPNGPGLNQWPSAAEDDQVVMELGEEQNLTPLTATPEREQFWRDWLPAQKPW